MSHEFEIEKPINLIDLGKGFQVIGQQVSPTQAASILDWCTYEKEAEQLGREYPDGSILYDPTRVAMKFPDGETVHVHQDLLWKEGMDQPVTRHSLSCSEKIALEMELKGLIQIFRDVPRSINTDVSS